MKFSVITCTYNSIDYIRDNIESVSKQDYRNFEHIFIDGFSTDGTLEVINEYSSSDPQNIKVYQCERKGISAAMNEGIKRSQADYLIHLHSDDCFYDDKVLADVNDYLTNNQDLDWIYGMVNVFKGNKESMGLFPKRKIFRNSNNNIIGSYLLKLYNYIPHQAVFIKKKVFDKFGLFDESISSAMDPDLWLRIREKTKWSFYDRIVSNYRIREGSQTSDYKNRTINQKNHWLVRRRYLNFVEIMIARIINYFIEKKGVNYK